MSRSLWCSIACGLPPFILCSCFRLLRRLALYWMGAVYRRLMLYLAGIRVVYENPTPYNVPFQMMDRRGT